MRATNDGLARFALSAFGVIDGASHSATIAIVAIRFPGFAGRSSVAVGPLEAVNGVLMLGMTAAALMAILQHMIKSQADAIAGARTGGSGS